MVILDGSVNGLPRESRLFPGNLVPNDLAGSVSRISSENQPSGWSAVTASSGESVEAKIAAQK